MSTCARTGRASSVSERVKHRAGRCIAAPFIVIFEVPVREVVPEELHTLTAANAWRGTLYLMPIHAPEARMRDADLFGGVQLTLS